MFGDESRQVFIGYTLIEHYVILQMLMEQLCHVTNGITKYQLNLFIGHGNDLRS